LAHCERAESVAERILTAEEGNMKRMILLLVLAVAMGFAVTASADKEICWNYDNPFGTDTIRVIVDDGGQVSGSWIIQVGGNPLIIPMVGTLQKDLCIMALEFATVAPFSGSNGSCKPNLRLSLHGTARDLSFSSPFIFDCFLDATLDRKTLNSVQIFPIGGSPSDLHSSVLAGCPGYFDPDDPFGSFQDTLTKVSCNHFPNPSPKP